MTKYICHRLSNIEEGGACGWGLAVGFWVSCEWKPRKEWWDEKDAPIRAI